MIPESREGKNCSVVSVKCLAKPASLQAVEMAKITYVTWFFVKIQFSCVCRHIYSHTCKLNRSVVVGVEGCSGVLFFFFPLASDLPSYCWPPSQPPDCWDDRRAPHHLACFYCCCCYRLMFKHTRVFVWMWVPNQCRCLQRLKVPDPWTWTLHAVAIYLTWVLGI